MLNNKDTTTYLQSLGLTRDEAVVYLALLDQANSHLKVSRITGVNRTKVYRIADDLEKRSLITTQTDDRGTLLVAADPRTLEVELVTREETLKKQRAILGHILPQLEQVQSGTRPKFIVKTYEGIEGFKQMLWHELRAEGEVLVFGNGALEDLVPNRRWAEKHRAKTTEAGYSIRELQNPGTKPTDFTHNTDFLAAYQARIVPRNILKMEQQVVIYNNTVATYHWHDQQKVGVEITDAHYTAMMRQIFETYWQLAS